MAQAGDSAGMEWLFHQYSPRLFGYFLHSTRNPHDAEDLLGELWIRLVKNIKRYNQQGRFEQWLFRIAANLARDRIRKLKTAPAKISIHANSDQHDDFPLPHSRIPDVDKSMMDCEARKELFDALEKLDDTTREMILLRHFSQESFANIAKQFDCPLGTALAKVHRGLKKMKELMGK